MQYLILIRVSFVIRGQNRPIIGVGGEHCYCGSVLYISKGGKKFSGGKSPTHPLLKETCLLRVLYCCSFNIPRRQTINVEPDDIIIANIRNNNRNGITFDMYVMSASNTVLSQQTLLMVVVVRI